MLIKKELATIDVLKCPEVKNVKKSVRYICAAEVFQLPRSGKVLVVDTFKRNKKDEPVLAMRFFTDAKIHLTCEEWPAKKWGHKNPEKLEWYSYFYSDPSDDELVLSILGSKRSWRKTVIGIVGDWVDDINWDRRRKREEAAESLQKKLFSMYPKLPENLGEYCDNHVFHNSYIFFSKKDKQGRRTARCGVCGHEFEQRRDVAHGQNGRCPKCGRYSAYKAAWIKKIWCDEDRICVAARVDGNLLLRWVTVHRYFDWPKFEKAYRYFDTAYNLHIQTEKGTTLYSYQMGAYDWHRNNNGTVCEAESFVYADNLDDVFGEKYHGVDLRMVIAQSGCNMRFGKLITNLEKYPEMEYLLKMGLTKLADQVSELVQTERSEKVSVQSVLGIDKQQLSVCRSMNVSLDELQIMRAYGKWISEDDLEEYRLLKIPGKYSGLVGSVLKNMSFEKFLNYFRKQRLLHFPSSTDQNITWYRDYIEMSEVLGVDLSRKSVRYPRDIKEAHDRLMTLLDSEGNEEVDAAFARVADPVVEDLGMYSYESKMFCIIVPQTRAEFIAEGQSLNHCVGRFPAYYNNHVAGTKMIFFIRKVTERERPFFTMEVDMKTFHILQLYGYGDCIAKKHVKRFAEGFVNALRKSREKGMKTA